MPLHVKKIDAKPNIMSFIMHANQKKEKNLGLGIRLSIHPMENYYS
jgi:hypothetical protein